MDEQVAVMIVYLDSLRPLRCVLRSIMDRLRAAAHDGEAVLLSPREAQLLAGAAGVTEVVANLHEALQERSRIA